MAEHELDSPDLSDDDLLLEDADGLEDRPMIIRVFVRHLYGRYTYDLKIPEVDGDASRLILLHGPNGSGKTKILRLIWDLLSTDEDKGHKSSVARVPFREFLIEFSDGRSVRAIKSDGLVGSYSITVSNGDEETSITANFIVDGNMSIAPSVDYGMESDIGRVIWGSAVEIITEKPKFNDSPIRQVMSFLKELDVKPAMLADDRNLYSDDRLQDRRGRRGSTRTAEQTPTERVIEELQVAIRRVNDWLSSLALSAQKSGSEEEAEIYLRVLSGLGGSSISDGSSESLTAAVEVAIDRLQFEVPAYSKFGLVAPFDADAFKSLLDVIPVDKKRAAYEIILPYLNSISARITALKQAEKLIRLITSHANLYLRDKNLDFRPAYGLRVLTNENKPHHLKPADLSSGERQVLLLLCNALLARRGGSLFIIDEPELSLGVIWQRRILDSLLECTAGTPIQFIIATHSIEIVTKNRKSLVRLSAVSDE
ncbi:AAA family ATPase [Rhodococcus erythropolis]|uniref:AAA family ATPase n=1 Tax=Rhodococcus erythropolis TaxID=1833 RepID=UPI003D132DD7